MSTMSQVWADTPFALIPVPHPDEDITRHHSSVWVAREMTGAHNCMLRCLNSIYHQFMYVKLPKDIKDLLTYITFWYDWVHEHHDGEEKIFFPIIEEASGRRGIMEVNVKQHDALESALEEFGVYAKETSVEKYDGAKIREILDRVGPVLSQHLNDEINTLLALDTIDSEKLKKAWNAFDLQMRNGNASVTLPIVFGTSDNEFPGAGEWPEVPAFIRMITHYLLERKHQSVWRFNPSTTWGTKRPLHFVKESA
ncbi:hypothetical protein F5884DRAFT_869636 [Xylogone sp. PMI_703]|nr:hypothetical protein F5884DRAFT_869636 [Xylogone sp. PMI_703]